MPEINVKLAQKRNYGWKLRGCGVDWWCEALVCCTLNSLILKKFTTILHSCVFFFCFMISMYSLYTRNLNMMKGKGICLEMTVEIGVKSRRKTNSIPPGGWMSLSLSLWPSCFQCGYVLVLLVSFSSLFSFNFSVGEPVTISSKAPFYR